MNNESKFNYVLLYYIAEYIVHILKYLTLCIVSTLLMWDKVYEKLFCYSLILRHEYWE